jgi:hypothetical protein
VGAAGLEPARLANYLKMQRELAQLDRKTDPRLTKETRARSKTSQKPGRKNPNRNG